MIHTTIEKAYQLRTIRGLRDYLDRLRRTEKLLRKKTRRLSQIEIAEQGEALCHERYRVVDSFR